jgi:hypothetical protein
MAYIILHNIVQRQWDEDLETMAVLMDNEEPDDDSDSDGLWRRTCMMHAMIIYLIGLIAYTARSFDDLLQNI